LFAGTSTLNQIERVLTWTGFPNQSDIQSLRSDAGESMLDNLKNVKQRNPKDWFSSVDDSVRDLMSRMLTFNPNKRLTIDQILKHPYLEEFYDPSNEPICEHRIVPNIS
jgi:serine/threonine protein kinase